MLSGVFGRFRAFFGRFRAFSGVLDRFVSFYVNVQLDQCTPRRHWVLVEMLRYHEWQQNDDFERFLDVSGRFGACWSVWMLKSTNDDSEYIGLTVH